MTPHEAFRANSRTFYNLATGDPINLNLRYSLIVGFGVILPVLGIVFPRDALSPLLSVLGVLLGFGYSVQFYIAGTSVPQIREDEYLEDAGDKRILIRLASEVYDNVVYLNFAILACLIAIFGILIPAPSLIVNLGSTIVNIVQMGGQFLSWIMLLEVVSTFYRVLVRSSFFFSERRRLEDD